MLDVEAQIFLRISVDSHTQQPVITYSKYGGMNLERTQNMYPEDIFKIHVDFVRGVSFEALMEVADNLGLPDVASKLAFLIRNLYECYIQRDCEEVLINPLVFTKDHTFRAANPRMNIDDNSLYR